LEHFGHRGTTRRSFDDAEHDACRVDECELVFDNGTMRTLADLQRGPDQPDAPPSTLSMAVTRTSTFDTPAFRDMTFHEVETKSVLNRVKGMPFNWSINPYRGCSHACSYCLAGDTPILMAAGRSKPLSDVRIGDRVYGTERRGTYRRYVITTVADHWTTVKPAYRVTLEDGTRLVASGDHRFLTSRGWKHVTGAERGAARRPHLTLNDRLMGVGRAIAGARATTTEHSRSFHAASPATTRQRTIVGRAVKGRPALDVVAIEPLGLRLELHDITTGTGDFIADGVISHNCFARPTHRYLNLSPGQDFERQVVVKTNCVEVLKRELARPSWRGERVAMGTNTDPYQRAEGRYRLMPGIISALGESRTPFSVLTKGTLITRDIPALVHAAENVPVTAAFTVGMLDRDLWRRSEPGTPSPRARLAAVRRLNQAGIPTGVMLAPIMPALNDDEEQLTALVDAAAEAGAVHISPIVLHLRRDVRPVFWPWLEREHPELVPLYERLYARGGSVERRYADRITELIARARRAAWKRHGRPAAPPAWRGEPDGSHPLTAGPRRRDKSSGEAPATEQLSLL
jgi:DNA repair photolyase